VQSVSSAFQDAFNADEMYLDHKLIAEFGSNRFNDNQVVTASSTKLARAGISSLGKPTAEFWKASDAFNNMNRNTMKWLVCDAGSSINEEADGTGYRAIHMDNTDTVGDYERGWWSSVRSNSWGVFSTPQWVRSDFDARRCNKIVLHLTEGYPSMGSVKVEYRNASSTWVEVQSFTMGTFEYQKEWTFEEDIIITGLRATVSTTNRSNDWARVSELNAYWIKDISEYVVSADLNEVREEYDRTVPIGTTSANTLSVELDNVDGLFNINNGDSIYARYIGHNVRVEFSLGIDKNGGVGSPNYEYTPMGEFWTDEWENSSDGMTTRFGSRDFSKFLQDELLFWGRVWTNTNIIPTFRDILLMLNLPLERIHINQDNLRGYQILFIKDQSPWAFFGEVALADQGVFGFNRNGDFVYNSYNTLDEAPYDTPVRDMNWNRDLIDGATRTELYANKVKVKVGPYTMEDAGIKRLWGANSPTVLSWSQLASGINASATTIPVTVAPRQTSSNLTAGGWPRTNGYLFLPKFTNIVKGGQTIREVTGGELIKYKKRTDSAFTECERGYLGTVAQSHSSNAYIGEARVWDVDFDNAPATTVKYPHVTAIDTLDEDAEEFVQAYVIHWEHTSFGAKLSIGNIVNYYTILAGSGPTIVDYDDREYSENIPFTTSVSGEVAIGDDGKGEKEIVDDPEAENLDHIRRYGKNEIEIDNQWIQSAEHADDIANLMISEYKVPRRVLDVECILPPQYELSDRIRITNFPQLDIQNTEYHLIRLNYSYSGGLTVNAVLREVRA
jgi:hypothetical protein